MLVRPHEHHGLVIALESRKLGGGLLAEALRDLRIEQAARRRRDGHAEDLLKLVDRAGRARAAGDDLAPAAGVDRLLDGVLRFVQQLRRTAARDVVLGVGIGVGLQQAMQVAFDEVQRAAGSGVVAIDHGPLAERGFDGGVHADHLLAQPGQV